jgi:DNA polymerase-1
MALPYKHVVVADFEFEFGGHEGNPPRPVCMVAKELRSGQEWRLWRGEFGAAPPFPTGPDSLFVAFYASAELGCFRALGWPMPENVLDLFTEFRARTNGTDWLEGRSLLAALQYFKVDGIGATEKQGTRELILKGPPWTEQQRADILDYCASDVYALERLLPRMLPDIDLPRALQRGRYMRAAAVVEFTGVPIDVDTLNKLRAHWDDIKEQLIADVDRDYGVFDSTTFKTTLFEEFLIRHGIPWPRLPSGRLALDRDTFKEMGRAYPIISPLRELKHALSEMRLNALQVGEDGRNRCLLSAFGTKTGRNAPSNTKFIFGPSVWLRGLVKPEPGRAVAYIDWSSHEVGIAASLSGDPAMMSDYRTGDPYLAFGKNAGILPPDATKESHGAQRDALKACVLGLQYGMGEETLAERIGKPRIVARELIRAHQQRYRKFWDMADNAIAIIMDHRPIQTVGGWPLQVCSDPNPNSVMNFPMQANGAEMLRLACSMATERGIEVHAPVHDAVLIGSSIDDIERDTKAMQKIMEEASRAVLGGFNIPTEAKIVRYPDRYMDKRGVVMWDRVMRLLADLREAVA